jgi:tyrosyl-tRNA synthetase
VPEGSIFIVDALIGLGLCASKGEARRKIGEGAIKVDDQPVSDPAATVAVTGQVKISFGKKKHGLLVLA